MQTVLNAQKMAFDYPAYDQATGLFVAGNVYDVSTGTPVFDSQVAMTHVGLGVYEGTFVPVGGKTYLVISAVYTDGTYGTIDTSRAAESDEYFCITDSTSFDNLLFAFDYTDYGQSSGLFVQAKVWDLSGASPALAASVTMVHVLAGCYFGSYAGLTGKTYVAEKAVYTDSGHTTPDTDRAPAGSDYAAFHFTSAVQDDNIRIRLTLAGRIVTSGNLAGKLSENLSSTGRPLAGRLVTSNNLTGRVALIGA